MEHKCICTNEERLRKLEMAEAVMGTKIDNLIIQLNKLTSTLKALVWLAIPTIMGIMGFLVTYWVKK